MRMPGFSAEASLQGAKMQYRNDGLMSIDGDVHPARIVRCDKCFSDCSRQGGEDWECNFICNRLLKCQ
jgi:hypothetical protein